MIVEPKKKQNFNRKKNTDYMILHYFEVVDYLLLLLDLNNNKYLKSSFISPTYYFQQAEVLLVLIQHDLVVVFVVHY